jgi:hypothetical protein
MWPYTGCPGRNLPHFGRVFLMLKYTDITQNTYAQSWTVTEIMVREKCGLLASPRTVRLSWLALSVCPWLGSAIAVSCISAVFVAAAAQSAMLSQCVTYSAWNSKDSYDTACEFFVVQFNGFMSLTSYFDVTYITLQKPHIPASFNMYLVVNKCVTPVKVSNFSGHYLHNCSTLEIGVLGYIGIL